MMTHFFVGIGVTGYEPARAWYGCLFGRSPDVTPKEDEAVWQLTSTGFVYIVADHARAGSGLLMLAVDDLEEHVARLGERGLVTERIETLPGAVVRAVIRDPDGNTITFFESPEASPAPLDSQPSRQAEERLPRMLLSFVGRMLGASTSNPIATCT